MVSSAVERISRGTQTKTSKQDVEDYAGTPKNAESVR